MTTTPPHLEAPDELDRLFSDFFKAQLTKPWPKAPQPGAPATNVPSELVAVRTADTPHNDAAPVQRDNTARARFTLVASVALMLGTSLLLSYGFSPGNRPVGTPTNGGSNVMPDLRGEGKESLDNIKKIRATEPKPERFKAPPIDMGNF